MAAFEKPLRVLAVFSSQKSGEAINTLLSAEGPLDVTPASSAGEARRMLLSAQFDIAVVNSPLSDEQGDALACDLCAEYIETLLFVKSELFDEVSHKVENGGVLTVQKPVSKALFHQAFRLAAAGSRRADSLINENRRLLQKIDEIKLAERAKWALIEHENMSEDEAHRCLEKRAMDLRITRADAARDVLIKYKKRS